MINKILIGFLKLLSRLPLSVWYLISDILYFPVKRFYRRKVVLNNLKLVFPEKSEKELNKIADGFYKNFCDLIVEIFKSLTISMDEIRARCFVENPEIFDQNNCPDQEVLMYSIHNANWEWLGLGLSAGSEYPCSPIVQVQSSEFAHEYMKIIRSRFKGVAIPKSSAARFILRNKNQKINVGILADQSPPHNQSKHWVNFLGVETPFINGLSSLPYLTQLPCYFSHFKRVKRGKYSIKLVKIGEPPFEKGDLRILRKYVLESEALILSDPSQYLWSHKRWKYPREENEELIKL